MLPLRTPPAGPLHGAAPDPSGPQDAYAAFYAMDTDRDGLITVHDLHKLLLCLLLNLTPAEFQRFLGLLGLSAGLTLNFREFRNLCERRPCSVDAAPQRMQR